VAGAAGAHRAAGRCPVNSVNEFALINLLPDPAGNVALFELEQRWREWSAARDQPPGPLVDVVRQLATQGVIRLAAPPVGLFLVLGATLRPAQATPDGA